MNIQVRSWEAFLLGVADGEINSKSVERVLRLTSSTAARKGISKVLIDARRVTGTLSTAERIETGARLADHVNKLEARLRVAFVGNSPTLNGLGVVAARKLGVNVMLFDNMSDAIGWLRHGHVSEKDVVRPLSAHA